MNEYSIICRSLSKVVMDIGDELTILHDVGFRLPSQQSLAITGPSGSGKSTLLGLLAGLDQPSAGEIQIAGQDILALNEDQRALWRRQRVGFVFQSFQLLPDHTALENVCLPLELNAQKNALSQATQMLERVGLKERQQHLPKYLSGGEQQRVALARAFVTKPQLLFADEPTGNLDFATGGRIIDLMFELFREHQTTLIMVTHDQQLAARCDAHLTLDQGQIVESRGIELLGSASR